MAVAQRLKELTPPKPFNFYSHVQDGEERIDSDMYPPLHHPNAIDLFMFTVMHEYGFWKHDGKRYVEPLYGVVDGRRSKGSDLLWRALRKEFALDPEAFTPRALDNLSDDDLRWLFSDDDGTIQFHDLERRLALSHQYARHFVECGYTPATIVEEANKSASPLSVFLAATTAVPGYDADDLLKKNTLLAMVLANRPERFLDVKDPEHWRPIVDYHLMRLSLRLGCVRLSPEEAQKSQSREFATAPEERKIRHATYDALKKLVQESGYSPSSLDGLLWMGRQYCPEMDAPACDKCVFDSICKKEISLFQPVSPDTTAY
jgi:hypothetical protein